MDTKGLLVYCIHALGTESQSSASGAQPVFI